MKHVLILILVLSLIGFTPFLADASQLVKEIEGDNSPSILWERNVGGPDTFGNTFIDSEEAGGPTYSWIDITASGTEIATSDGLGDDDRTGPYPIGFLFPFYGHGEEFFWVQSNGCISFSPVRVGLTNHSLPYSGLDAMIALFWDDLDPHNGEYGSVYYETLVIDSHDVCVVTFEGYCEHPPSPSQDTITMQVLFSDDGRVRVQYQNIDAGFDRTSCSIGIQNHDGTDGLTCIFNDGTGEYPYNSLAIDFLPPDPSATLSGIIYQNGGGRVADANVRVGCGQTTSDETGHYTITGVYPGTHSYLVWKNGYNAVHAMTTLSSGDNSLYSSLAFSPTPITGGFSTDFESGPQVFSSAGEWEFGTPSASPDNAHSGTNAWSTNLDANYGVDQDDWLMSQFGFVIENNQSLRYYQWHDYDQSEDGYNVHISTTAGAFWTLIYPEDGYSDPDGFWNPSGEPVFCNWGQEERMWVQRRFPLDDYVGQTVWFAFRHVTDSSINRPGVTIDDMEINVGNAAPYVRLTLFPLVTTVPSSGGTITADAQIISTYPFPVSGRTWTDVILPNGNPYGPLMNAPTIITPGTVYYPDFTQNIPAYAPSGDYTMNAYIGYYPDYVAAFDSFPFTKTDEAGPDGEITSDWEVGEWELADMDGDQVSSTALPDQFDLRPVWPNPFNASATVTVDLPEASDLSVVVFSLDGREVAVLTQGYTPAGIHNLHFNGEGLATGIYFVKAKAGDNQTIVRKVTLLK